MEACARGPSRAIKIGQIMDLWSFFSGFLKGRNMYYLEPNIVKPLTKKYKLSYAELVGPNQVMPLLPGTGLGYNPCLPRDPPKPPGTRHDYPQSPWSKAPVGLFDPPLCADSPIHENLSQVNWFVSHYWGHPFMDTVSSIKKHAQKFCEPGKRWEDIA